MRTLLDPAGSVALPPAPTHLHAYRPAHCSCCGTVATIDMTPLEYAALQLDAGIPLAAVHFAPAGAFTVHVCAMCGHPTGYLP